MKMTRLLSSLAVALVLGFIQQSDALTFQLPGDGTTLVGTPKTVKTVTGDTLTSLGRRYDMGTMELKEANPELSLDAMYGPGKSILIPSQFILPDAPHKGLVLNLAELRIYFYKSGTKEVITFPVGIGRDGWSTPEGITYITDKTVDPTWVVPQSIIDDRLQDGVDLPHAVPAGPANPLGGYRMRLAIPNGNFLMHGSNDPTGIGRRSSSGCIRMQPEAVASIFDDLPVHTQVDIVDQPVKVGWLENDLYIEAHIPLNDHGNQNMDDLIKMAHDLVAKATSNRPANVDWDAAEKAVKEQRGYPIKIGTGTGPVPQVAVPVNPSPLVGSASTKAKKGKHNHKEEKHHETSHHLW